MTCPDCGETDMTRYTGTGCQHLAAESPVNTGDIEIVNLHRGGIYSIHDWSRDRGMFEHTLGQVYRRSPGKWEARRHGTYLLQGQFFGTRRDAIASLIAP